jgi:hypothetical protein
MQRALLRLLFTQDSLVSALEEMTIVLVFDVEVTGITKLEVLHESGERIAAYLNQEMERWLGSNVYA